jgi:4-hydroxymandelate oxidase
MADASPAAVAGPSLARATRRQALRRLATFVAGSPLLTGALAARTREGPEGRTMQQPPAGQAPADGSGVVRPPVYAAEIMKVVNLHEFEEIAKTKIARPAYDYVAAGAADELTLRANREAFGRFWIRRRVGVDVSHVDTSLELLGLKLPHPILLGPAGAKNLLHPSGDRLATLAAHQTSAVILGPSQATIQELVKNNETPMWWAATLGHLDRSAAIEYAKRSEDAGAAAICVTVDYPYTGARDRPSRHQWNPEWSRTAVFSTSEFRVSFQAGMLDPYNPNMTWAWMDWVRAATKLPIVVKGILTGEDARLAVEHGARAVVVSNHGARTLDGTGGTLDCLPEVVEAVAGRIPVLVDGGIRRGGDVIKALALGARAILIGRPYMWGLAAFGQEGMQRVIELLHGELRMALALSGTGTVAAVDRTLVRPAWKPYTRPGRPGSGLR